MKTNLYSIYKHRLNIHFFCEFIDIGEVILKINIVFAEKIKAEVYVNQDKSLFDLQTLINLNIHFFCIFLMNY
jgi:predicted nucleotidyltransferase component of viral defense system